MTSGGRVRYVDGNGTVYNEGCWLRRLSESRVFPVVGKNGSALLQPGPSLGLDGRGTCMVDNSSMTFTVKTVSGNVMWNCDKNWSVLRKRSSTSTIYEQDSSVWKLGLEDFVRNNYPNQDGDEFWLFPTPTYDVGKSIIGNGGAGIDTSTASHQSINGDNNASSRGILVQGVKRISCTVVLYSNSLKTQTALEHNFLWDFSSGRFSRNVFMAWYENVVGGTANVYPLELRRSVNAPGASSSTYGFAAVLSRYVTLSSASAVAVMPPIFRVHDFDSMFGSSYSDSSTIKVETVYQFATT